MAESLRLQGVRAACAFQVARAARSRDALVSSCLTITRSLVTFRRRPSSLTAIFPLAERADEAE
jgi:hypothetical protein